jgi:putative transposase
VAPKPPVCNYVPDGLLLCWNQPRYARIIGQLAMSARVAAEITMSAETVTRRRLRHWYQPGYAHFITYRLAGSILNFQLRKWRRERTELIRQAGRLPYDVRAARRSEIERQYFKRYDDLLDQRPQITWLAESRVAAVVRENLYHHHGEKYQLLAYCIMPNHVHVLLQPFQIDAAPTQDRQPLSDEIPDLHTPLASIMHSLKSYTANKANELLGREGSFWQRESYDHWVRDLDELERIVDYIRANPVRAGLCKKPTDWSFSSAYDRYQTDGSESALVGWLRDDWKR